MAKKRRWKSPKVGERRKLHEKCGSACFLKPGMKYPVCPTRTRTCQPSCQGLEAARRRAITQRDYGVEKKAIAQARLLRCSWASEAKAKRGRGRKKARKAA
jgi:hypothetical protein